MNYAGICAETKNAGLVSKLNASAVGRPLPHARRAHCGHVTGFCEFQEHDSHLDCLTIRLGLCRRSDNGL